MYFLCSPAANRIRPSHAPPWGSESWGHFSKMQGQLEIIWVTVLQSGGHGDERLGAAESSIWWPMSTGAWMPVSVQGLKIARSSSDLLRLENRCVCTELLGRRALGDWACISEGNTVLLRSLRGCCLIGGFHKRGRHQGHSSAGEGVWHDYYWQLGVLGPFGVLGAVGVQGTVGVSRSRSQLYAAVEQPWKAGSEKQEKSLFSFPSTFPSPFNASHLREKWQPLQYSCLENPVDGGAWWAACCP